MCVCERERERERERKREIQKRSPRIWRIILFREKPEVYNNGKLCNNKKKKEILPFAITWMDLEGIKLK